MAGTKATNNRKPYTGDKRALVIAFDVGTTFSGVSYAFLEPGEVPKIHGVTRYPGQEHVTGNTKIPSLLYYDRSGNVVAAGAEAEGAQIADQAEDEGWTKVELFKLRLRPRRMELDMNGMRLSSLPHGKSSEDVFGDFLHYLYVCTRKFIEDTHANGKNVWRAVHKDINFVLSHPNGWEGAQQSRMRRAAISGGLIPNTDEGRARVRFVTEGEASMHACILSGLAQDVLASGNGFIVADAGGGTLDISSYILQGTHPLRIEEVAPPDCVFSGAVFVSRRCRVFLEEKLRHSKYGSPDTLDHITRRFDETTKRLFRDKNDPQFIPFGSPLDRDSKAGIRSGQLKLSGQEVADLFEPSIDAAVNSIRKQVEAARGVVKAVWLVGGFAASPWLFSQLQARLSPLGITVNRPDTQTSKAVADGAIGFFCDHHVSARMSRYMYGVEYLREINENDAEHVARGGRQLQLPSGPKYLPDAFDCILAKNVRVKESSVFSRKYYTEVTKPNTLSVFEIEIWCYRGGETIPRWIDRNSDHFGSLCFVRADLSKLSNSAEPKTGANGQTYWTVVFSIEIHFGLTEFKARMKWNEDGRTKYGPATIVFNEKGVRSDEDDALSIVGVDSVPPSPRKPLGSLYSHRTSSGMSRTTSQSQSQSHSHAPTSSSRTSSSRHSHNPPAPPPLSSGAPSLSRGMSAADMGMEDVPPPLTPVEEVPPPIARSSTSTVRGGSVRTRSIAPEPEPEAAEEPFIPPLPPASVHSHHSRAPSIAHAPSTSHVPSRTPSHATITGERVPTATGTLSRSMSTATATAAGERPSMSRAPSHISRTPSNVVPPSPPPQTASVHSRAHTVTGPAPSVHSRAPTVTGPAPSVHSSHHPSRAPSVAPSHHSQQQPMSRAPSTAHVPAPALSVTPSMHSHVPSVARLDSRAPSAVPSRAPSAYGGSAVPPVASRAPSVAPATSPVMSRAPSAAPSVVPGTAAASPVVSRAPSAAPLAAQSPVVSRAPSVSAGAGSKAPSMHSRTPSAAGTGVAASLKPSRAPSLARSLSHQSARSVGGGGSGSRTPLGPVEEAPAIEQFAPEAEYLPEAGDGQMQEDYVDVRPPPGESAREYYDAPGESEQEQGQGVPPGSTDWALVDAPPPLGGGAVLDRGLPPPPEGDVGGGFSFDFGAGAGAAPAQGQGEAGHAGFGAFGSVGGGLSKGIGESMMPWDAPTSGAPGGWDFGSAAAPVAAEPEPAAESEPIPEPEPAPAPAPEPAPVIAPSVSKASSKGGKKLTGKAKKAAEKAAAAEEAARLKAVEEEEAAARQRAAEEEAAAAAQAQAQADAEAEQARLQAEAEEAAARHAAEEQHARFIAEEARAAAEKAELERQEEELAQMQAEQEAAVRAAEERERVAREEEEERVRGENEARERAEREVEEARVKEEEAIAAANAVAEADAAAAAAATAAQAGEPAMDEEYAKELEELEAGVEKLRNEVEKKTNELKSAKDDFEEKSAPKGKGKNKKKPTGPAVKSAERAVAEKESALQQAETKLKKAEEKLAEKRANAPAPAPVAAAVPAPEEPPAASVPAPSEDPNPDISQTNETDEFVDAPLDNGPPEVPSKSGSTIAPPSAPPAAAPAANDFWEPPSAKKDKKKKKKGLAAELEEAGGNNEEEGSPYGGSGFGGGGGGGGAWGGKSSGFLDNLGIGEQEEKNDGGFNFGGSGAGGWGSGLLSSAKKGGWFS